MQDSTQFLGLLLAALGGLGLLAGIVLLRFPSALRAGVGAFPRSKWPGWILTAFCLFWVSWVIRHAALGRFEVLKPLIPVLALLVFAAIVWFLDELLSPRALGGLLLLVANPMLNGVRWADSAWRLVPALIAYAWVIAGCAWMLHPWLFRKMAERFLRSDRAVRWAGWGKLLAGAVLLAAGLWHLR
ncbi:MAG: hypothetical protein Q8M07_06265 [Prosthecobacter sp.]|nr:hypothetical protein [Prosthecobacter sp.]